MIADLTIPFFEWWMVPTVITVFFLAIWFFSKESPGNAMENPIGFIVGGFIDIAVTMICLIIPLISWLIYFIFN
jgi:hypothetical protein